MAFIYDAIRVPTGKKGGLYKNILPEELCAFLIDKLIERNDLEDHNIELIVGNAIGTMGNMARNSALRSNLKRETPANTVDLQCGGAYQALKYGLSLSALEPGKLFITGGMESNSLMPQRSYHKNDPRSTGEVHLPKAQFSPYSSLPLELAAEKLALDYKITKKEMMAWTVKSHQNSSTFQKTDFYKERVIPFGLNNNRDEVTKTDLSLEKLVRLGTDELIDRTTSADFHDGAGLLLLASREIHGCSPLAKVLDVEIAGLDPDESPRGCIVATEKLLQNNDLVLSDIDAFEVNESFSCKPIAFARHFGLNEDLVNPLGGNLSMGHPYAASGVLNMINLIAALKLKKKRFGLVSAGIAGGYGAAVLIENLG